MYRKEILEIAQGHDSFYIYDGAVVSKNIDRLKDNFHGIEFFYSVKCNPFLDVVRAVFNQGLGADCASLGEVEAATGLGVPREKVHFSAPGKSDMDIEESLEKATIICDSIDEVRRTNRIAENKAMSVDIGIRINPAVDFYGGPGIPSKFGIDEAQYFVAAGELRKLKNVKIVGFHVHQVSQELDWHIIKEYHSRVFSLGCRLGDTIEGDFKFINLGSGIGIPYGEDDTEVDVDLLGRATSQMAEDFHRENPGTRIIIETGRYIVGKAGTYITRVMDKKESLDKVYVILKNTLNGFARPALANVMSGHAREPLFTGKNAFAISAITESQTLEKVTLAGNLCTSADIIAEDIVLPRLKPGDLVIINNAGAYGATLSPMEFSMSKKPVEFYISEESQ